MVIHLIIHDYTSSINKLNSTKYVCIVITALEHSRHMWLEETISSIQPHWISVFDTFFV